MASRGGGRRVRLHERDWGSGGTVIALHPFAGDRIEVRGMLSGAEFDQIGHLAMSSFRGLPRTATR